MFSRLTKFMLVILVLFIFGCSMTANYKKPDGSDYSLKTKATSDYITTRIALLDAKRHIAVTCANRKTIVCGKAKRYYNVAADAYVAMGEFNKALVDPANSASYSIQAMSLLDFASNKYRKYTYLITVINQIKDVFDLQSSDEIKFINVLVIINGHAIDVIFEILEGGM